MYNVMLVDDEYMILMGLKKIIPWNDYGFTVVATAENAKDALTILEKETIDLVITDVTMPEMSGLAFIQAAQNRHDFEFMILSGYQEFDYLKSGLQLGAINYLMKPVNKVELVESLLKVKERLKERTEQKNQQELYHEFLLSQWLNDELSEGEEAEVLLFMKNFQPSFRVIVGHFPTVYKKQFIQNLEQKKQKLYYFRNLGEAVFFVIIYENGAELSHFIQELETLFAKSHWVISYSEVANEVEEVPLFYKKARQIYELHEFYEGTSDHILKAPEEGIPDSFLDLAEFNRLVVLNKPHSLKKAVQKIFQKLISLGVSPEDVRHVTFLLFMDVYRQMGELESSSYFAVVQEINQANTVSELEKLLLKVIDEQKEPVSYSENVQNVLEIIGKNYQEELTLKRVSDELHLNVVYLGQLFKKELKQSFSQYLNQFRMEKGKNLLLHSEKNINEIAFEIGYNNSNYFSKMFKKMYDITPKEYRERE